MFRRRITSIGSSLSKPVRSHWLSKSLVVLLSLAALGTLTHADSITIGGLNDEQEANVRAFLSLTGVECDASAWRVESLAEDAVRETRKALRPLGYYHAKIDAEFVAKTENDDCWSLALQVDPGEPIIIRSTDFLLTGGGKLDPVLLEQILSSSVKKGNALHHGDYEALKSRLEGRAAERGYLDAEITERRVDVYPDEGAADVILHMSTGRRFKLGEISVVQDAPKPFLDQTFLEQMVLLDSGQYYTSDTLFDLRGRLAATGYFNQVLVDLDYQARADGLVPLNVKVTPGKRIRYSTGVGFSTDTGPRISFGFEHKRIGEYGHQLNSELSLSPVISEFATTYKIPSSDHPLERWYNIEAGFRSEDSDSVNSETAKLGISQTRKLGGGWQNIAFIDAISETFDTGQDDDKAFLLVPGTNWSITEADNPVYPEQGYRINFQLQGASDSLGSDVSFVQATASAKWITTFAENNRLLARAEVGSTSVSDILRLPTSYRFFAGGDNSVRGYDFNSLGPTNDVGDVIGGEHLAIVSLEYERRISQSFALAAFVDAGNAFNDEDFELKKSVGVGVRWLSPIGPVRLDLGVPIGDDDEDFRLHFSLGPDL